MATYVNDLRLKEIATGDESGTWGTSTNTNLELIGEAMGVGAEAVANASTHTITMADGATDQFRSTFLRLTGGGQACTVTLAPNTLSHTWIMRNETAAALTLTQGTGANVVIAAGQTKIVATDGAGSGAIVYEMDDLELAGNLAVGGTLAVTGAFTNGSTLVSTGKITADAGIDIDNINIDGTTIALSSGDLTLDVAGDIVLDADGGEIRFKDGGTEIAVISNKNAGGTVTFASSIADKDIQFVGNDGGSAITALTLDMSAAGAAAFNSSVTASNFVAGATGANGILKAFTADIGNGENSGINLYNSAGSDTSWFITPGVTGVNNTDFCIRDGTNNVNALTLAVSSGAATLNNGLTLTDGNLVVADGHGIDFSADGHASGMSSELLDDYEEGAWTPAFQNIGNGTYNLQVGKYTKIGNLVAASFHIDINALGTASGALIITGLPFTADNISDHYGSFTTTHASGWSAALTNLGGLVSPGTTVAPVFYQTSTQMIAATQAQMQTGNFLAYLIYQSS